MRRESHRVWNGETMFTFVESQMPGERMDCSGATDCNGQPIFAGDVISWPVGPKAQQVFVAEYNEEYGKWNFLPQLSGEMTVMGNIHEHPDCHEQNFNNG